MNIEAKRVVLIPLDKDNLQKLLSYKSYNFEDIDNRITNPDQLLKNDSYLINLRLNQLIADDSLKDWLLHIIINKQNYEVVGHVGFHNQPDENKTVEFGITIGSSRRRKGFGYEAVQALCSWAIDNTVIGRIQASVSPENKPSIKLINKLGLKKISEQIDQIDGLEYVFQTPAKNFSKIPYLLLD